MLTVCSHPPEQPQNPHRIYRIYITNHFPRHTETQAHEGTHLAQNSEERVREEEEEEATLRPLPSRWPDHRPRPRLVVCLFY